MSAAPAHSGDPERFPALLAAHAQTARVEPDRVRVNVQLIDAITDEHLWAERFDKERKDILEVQDEIVARLSRSVGIEMVRTEAARGSASNSRDAVDLVMRARAQSNDIKRRENAARAVELFRQALDLDPDNVDALAGIAALCSYQVVNLYRLDERDALLNEAEVFLSRATALAPDHAGVLKARAFLLRARGRFADAVIATETVIARNPGEPLFYKEMGLNKLYLGETQEAAQWFRRADEIAPRDPRPLDLVAGSWPCIDAARSRRRGGRFIDSGDGQQP